MKSTFLSRRALVAKFSALALATTLIAGCMSPYSKRGVISLTGGYRDKQLGPDIYEVSFAGNGYTSLDRARVYTLLRCADLTIEKGCDYFAELTDEQVRASLPTLHVNPRGSFGTPSTYQTRAVIKVFKGAKPAEFHAAREARALKSEIEAALAK